MNIVCMVNSEYHLARLTASLSSNLGRGGRDLCVLRPATLGLGAAATLNIGLEQSVSEWVCCIHQDVRLPEGWIDRVERELGGLPPNVAVAGVVGTDMQSRFIGHIVDPNGHSRWRQTSGAALTIDEVAIFVRRSSRLRFDASCPGFHCYGADISLAAIRKGLSVHVIDSPLLHLSTGTKDAAYGQASKWLLEKWSANFRASIPTPAGLHGERRYLGSLRVPGIARIRRRWSALQGRGACRDAACVQLFDELVAQEREARHSTQIRLG
jgi:hypothetical protein